MLLYSITLVLVQLLACGIVEFDLLLQLLQLPLVLLNRLIFLINLLLQRTGDLHHIFIVLRDVVPRTVDLHRQILQSELSLMQTDVQ